MLNRCITAQAWYSPEISDLPATGDRPEVTQDEKPAALVRSLALAAASWR